MSQAISNTERLCLSVDEAARACGIGRSLAFKLIAEKRLPAIRLGRRLVVPKAQLEKMLEQGSFSG
jgi:excisionase family DNA binding protein